jgi:hypothetical protein
MWFALRIVKYFGIIIPLFGVLSMIAKGNVKIGIEWRFGDDWPGQRCGAKTRKGTACQRPANKKNGRCRLHGGASTGPKTDAGRAMIAKSNTKHGKYTKDKILKRKEDAKISREFWARTKRIEIRLRAAGVID